MSKDGFNDYLTTELSLLHDWALDEASPDANLDSGSDTAAHLIPGGGATYEQAGDVSYETDEAMGFDGTSGANTINTTTTWNYTSGAMIFVFNSTGDFNDVLFGYGNSGTTQNFWFRPTTLGRFQVFMQDTGSNDLSVISDQTAGVDFFDGNYHFVIVNQPGDGTGMDFIINGVPGGISSSSYTGSKDADSWYHDAPADGRVTLGATPDGANANWLGDVSRVAMATSVVTALQGSELQALRTQASLQAGANKRRRGRKYFVLGAS
jgi:hypothetical protein